MRMGSISQHLMGFQVTPAILIISIKVEIDLGMPQKVKKQVVKTKLSTLTHLVSLEMNETQNPPILKQF